MMDTGAGSGMKTALWLPVDQAMTGAADMGVFPGAVLLAGNRGIRLFQNAFGYSDSFAKTPMTVDTIFDLASLTKSIVTTTAVMKLIQQGRLSLETPVSDILADFRNPPRHLIQIRHLLYHTSGLPAHRHYYLTLKNLAVAQRRGALRRMLAAEPLEHPVGKVSVYSDLGFMVLCWVIEEITHVRLDAYATREIFQPLGLNSLFFMDLARPAIPHHSFAATEFCHWRGKLLSGEVSDDNAWVTGGIDGHAGLFGAAGDVYSLLATLLTAHVGESDFCGISPELVRIFLKRDSHSGRALGFDTPSPVNSSSGGLFSRNTVGHLGFTGTSFWMDLDREAIVVLLTNRVHPDRQNNRIRGFRPLIHDLVMNALLSDIVDTSKQKSRPNRISTKI